jgi:hypothetical protein
MASGVGNIYIREEVTREQYYEKQKRHFLHDALLCSIHNLSGIIAPPPPLWAAHMP